MFIYSFKANKKVLLGAALVVLALIVLFFAVPGRAKQTNSVLKVPLKAESNEERIAFIENFGYDVRSEPVEMKQGMLASVEEQCEALAEAMAKAINNN